MSAWFDRFLRRGDGVSTVELAVTLPLILLVMTGIAEFGRALYQTTLIERGLRAAGIYGARADLPINSTTLARMEHLVKTGSLESDAPYLLTNWANPNATVSITVSSYDTGQQTVPVFRIEASVPFEPMIPGMFQMFGFEGFTIGSDHEQAYVGQ